MKHDQQLVRKGVEVIGISRDSIESHQKFAQKHQLNFTLLSDPEHKVIEQYHSWGMKKFLGKEYEGISRNTFLINPEGEIGYWVFLRNISIGVPWSLNTLHLVMPLAALLSWFLYRHTTRLPWKYAIFWLGFPLAYLIYTFTRAAVINWYPYDFLNPQIQGYPGVLKNIALLMTPGFITGLILVWIGNRCLDKKKNS